MVGQCLVISPFLPKASDAGHRKRTFESCQSIADLGYDLTLIHLAFEGDWFWRRQSVNLEEMKACGVSQYHEIFVDDIVGRQPNSYSENSEQTSHALDEWWHPALEAFLINYLRRNYFEMVVVHNVWLSKAFDFFPSSTIRAIETHDIFSIRESEFNAIGAKQDFYSCSEQDEVFGLNRANLCIGIKEEDSRWMAARGNFTVLTIPPRVGNSVLSKVDYQCGQKVVFGFMGSAHAFNVHAIDLLLNELKQRLLKNPAPLEFVIAGTAALGLDLSKYPFVRNLGFVKEVSEFYQSVDIVVSPLDHGTGLKIKVAEAIELEVPIIATRHSAAGTKISGLLLTDNVWTLADEMIRKTNDRLPFEQWRSAIRSVRAETIAEYQSAVANLREQLECKRRRFIVYLPELFLPPSHPLKAACQCLIRTLAGQGSVFILVSRKHESKVESLVSKMPASVATLAIDIGDRSSNSVTYLDVADEKMENVFSGSTFITSDANVHSLRAKYEICDERLSCTARLSSRGWPNSVKRRSPMQKDWTEILGLPLFGGSIWWDPNCKPPFISSDKKQTIFWRVDASVKVELLRVLTVIDPSSYHVVYSNASDLNEMIPDILRGGKLASTVLTPVPEYSLEVALIEYLKCFNINVKCIASNEEDLLERSERLNILEHEPALVQLATEFLY